MAMARPRAGSGYSVAGSVRSESVVSVSMSLAAGTRRSVSGSEDSLLAWVDVGVGVGVKERNVLLIKD